MRAETDPAIIASVLKHPAIFPHIRDDATPDDWMPEATPNKVFLMPDDNSACFVYSQHSGVLAEGHLAVLPEARRDGVAMGLASLQWLRDNTDLKAVMGLVSALNTPACRYVERVGFVRSGTIKSGFAKDGGLVDLAVYSLEL